MRGINLFLFSNIDNTKGERQLRRISVDGGTNILLHLINNIDEGEVHIVTQKGNKVRFLQTINNRNVTFWEFSPFIQSIFPNWFFLEILFRSFFLPVSLLIKYPHVDYLVSSSDFWPDSIPAFIYKMFHPKTKWVAGFFLMAPAPWSKNNPYKRKNFVIGLMYWLTQLPIYFLIKSFANYVLVTSEPDKKKFVTNVRNINNVVVAKGGVDVLPSTAFFEKIHAHPEVKKKYDACFLGRFHFQKGVIELIEIWRRVVKSSPKAKLAMIGDGPLKTEVEKLIKRYRLQRNVILFGYLDGKKKYNIFKESRIIIHPAIYDSGGMSAAEGMAWKLPGVSFDLEALKTYYPKGMLKVPCYDIDEFAITVKNLLSNKDLYKKLSSEARQLILKEWSWPTRCHKILEQIK